MAPSTLVRREVGGLDQLAFDPGRGAENLAMLIANHPSDLTHFMEAPLGPDEEQSAFAGT